LVNDLHAVIERTNELATLAAVLGEMDTVTAVIDELLRYASYHFDTEERYMLQHGYPDYEGHRADHRQFKEKVAAFKSSFDRAKTRLSTEIAEFLKTWWQTHILAADKKCGAFLNKQGLR
jgi:hemerythrin-like metal-binding protein